MQLRDMDSKDKRCRFDPGLERSPGVGNGTLLHCSYLENSMDRGTWQATVHEAAESDMTEHTAQTYHSMNMDTLSKLSNSAFK